MTPQTWEKLKIPSHHVLSVKDDPETGGYEVVVDIARIIKNVEATARAEGRANTIEDLREAMDTYNSLPAGATQFAFYLRVQDMKAFFDALNGGGK